MQAERGRVVKAISLWQPWASAVSIGAKRIETRSWSTRYRGPIAIHAAKRKVKQELEALCWENWVHAVFGSRLERLDQLPFGAILATAELVDCLPVAEIDEDLLWRRYGEQEPGFGEECFEIAMGNYQPGRYGWILDNVKPLPEPIPYRGQQGLWTVPEGVLDV